MTDKYFKQYFLENLPGNVYNVTIELCNRFLKRHLQKALLYEEYIFAFHIFREFLDEHNISYSIPSILEYSRSSNYQTAEGIGDFFKQVKSNIQSLELSGQFRKKTLSALWQENHSSKTTELPSERNPNDAILEEKDSLIEKALQCHNVYIQTYQNKGDTFMADTPKKYTKNEFSGSFAGGFISIDKSQGNRVGGSIYANHVGGIINNYPPEQKQNLADAAAEIQQLLQQLEQNYPNATEIEKQSALAVTLQQEIKQNPTLKARLINALKEGGIEALKVLFGPIGIPIEMVKGWIEAETS
ncbi:MAG: hypothetical protein SWX82_14920 [Cyanobacteriota bacterium]|nr:hypothetical protein [Cyanobacteriota bacterium]